MRLRGAAVGAGADGASSPGRSGGIRPLLLMTAAIFSIWRWAASGETPAARIVTPGAAAPAPGGASPGALAAGSVPATPERPAEPLAAAAARAESAAISAAVRLGRKRGTISSGVVSSALGPALSSGLGPASGDGAEVLGPAVGAAVGPGEPVTRLAEPGPRTTVRRLLPSASCALDMLPTRRSMALPVLAFSDAIESHT